MKKYFYLIVLSGLVSQLTFADEGMWLPYHIKRLNHTDMEKMGLKLTADEIYNVNNSSLKDAIVSLGGFCTAEVISNEGLMLTNHHCAYDAIQENSTVEHDYLTDGFWAYKKEQEIHVPGLTASFLVKMEDYTDLFNKRLKGKKGEDKYTVMDALMDSLETEAQKDNHYTAKVKSFFNDNEFYLFLYEVFKDVRLVGAPPSSIGKFGGDTDNWMWPRHTGDFSMLRVYANAENKPADFAKDNKPYTPKHFLPISMDGVDKNDYAMIMGYPGSTDRFLSSYGVSTTLNKENPARIKIREKRLATWKEDMNANAVIRIKYASKYAQVSNYYKYFIGQNKGLIRLKVEDKKRTIETALRKWIDEDATRKAKYGEIFSKLEGGYGIVDKGIIHQVYFSEAVMGVEILSQASKFMMLNKLLENQEVNHSQITAIKAKLKGSLENHFKDYDPNTDKKVFAALIQMYHNALGSENIPKELNDLIKKHKNDYEALAEYVFSKSIFDDPDKLKDFSQKPSTKVLAKDPAFIIMNACANHYRNNVAQEMNKGYEQIDEANHLFVAAIREMQTAKTFYPDANSTMRLTYGKVMDYYPQDAVHYNFYTTLEGIMEKDNPNDPDFEVPQKLRELYKNKDFGPYAENGEMRVCFISNNDITGGNSGSPVINAKGELIGCAFDGNWEAMSGDIAFETELQRTISVDIRYVLFIIDKYAGATNLIQEMKLVKTGAN